MFKDLSTKENAKGVLTTVNTIIYVLMFMTTLVLFYPNINYYLNGFTILLLIYTFLYILFGKLFECFSLGDARVVDQVVSQALAFCLTNCLIYAILCLISFMMLSLKPIIILSLLDIMLSTLLLFNENRYIRDNYPVLNAIAIVGEDHYSVLDKIGKYRDILVTVSKKYDAKRVDFDSLEKVLKDVDRVITIDITHEEKKKVFKACYERRIKVFDIPSITDILFASSDIMHVIDTPILKVNKYGPNYFESIMKRMIDIIGSLLLIVITSPIMLISALAVKLYDKGTIIYKQVRLTKDSKEFSIYKFRSMVMNAENKTGAVLAKQNDDRITPIGKFLRKTRFDELPQLFNILLGDMSFVGPRPERPEIYEEILQDTPEFKFRLVVKAGLTGYAQIYGKYNTSIKDKLLLDMYYIEKYSLVDDIKLIIMTAKMVFKPESTEGVKGVNN